MPSEAIQDIPLDTFCCDQRVRRRLNDELVEQMAKSLQMVGQLQPVRARWVDERLRIVDGHHRLAAAYLSGMKTLACIIEAQSLDDGEVIQRQLISNCLRESVTGLEAARAIKQLMNATGCSASQAATSAGFSNAKVTRLLALLSLPAAIVEQVESGAIPASAAYELARIEDAEQQAELARQLAEGRLTRDGIAGKRRAAKASNKRNDARTSRVTAILGATRSITISAEGLTLDLLIELMETLLTKARRERTRGAELSTFVRILRDQARAK